MLYVLFSRKVNFEVCTDLLNLVVCFLARVGCFLDKASLHHLQRRETNAPLLQCVQIKVTKNLSLGVTVVMDIQCIPSNMHVQDETSEQQTHWGQDPCLL